MPDELELFGVLQRHGVPFVIIGGHAVNFHGYGRATEDTDIVWHRSPEAERNMLLALTDMDARYIAKEIDPATGIERTYPVTLPFIQASRLMMLWTKYGFLDLFDYLPGLPHVDVRQLLTTSIEAGGVRYVSLPLLRQMKHASARTKDRLDLENLPE
ncbi:MAG: hypothetical protein ABSB74_01380 [Tepidisphaeraceae bacterium]